MGGSAIHNWFASHTRSLRALAAACTHTDVQPDRSAAATRLAAAKRSLLHRAAPRRLTRPVLPPLLPTLRALLPSASAVDSGDSVPTSDASVANLTTPRSSPRSARPCSPSSTTAGEFPHSLVGPQIAAGLELRQTARVASFRQPFFWRHVSAGLCRSECFPRRSCASQPPVPGWPGSSLSAQRPTAHSPCSGH
jgi:hypothetical protein